MARVAIALTLGALAWAGAVGAPAGAADLVVRDGGTIGAFASTGDGVVWESGPLLDYVSFGEGPVRLRSKRGRRRARTLATLGTYGGGVDDVKGGEGGTIVTVLDVVGGRVLVGSVGFTQGDPNDNDARPIYDRAVLQSIDLANGRAATIQRCPSSEILAVALAWPRVVLKRCAHGPIELRDAAGRPRAPATTLAQDAVRLEAAGDKLALQTAEAIVVRDVATGSELLRIALATLPGRLSTWDVQADGAVALAYERDGGGVLAWVSPAAPQLHEVAAGVPYELQIADDRIVWQEGEPQADRPAKIAVVSLDGGQRDLVSLTAGDGRFAFDGQTLLWSRRHCAGNEIVSRAIDEGPPDTNRFAACPLYIDRESARFSRPRRLTVGADCPALAPARASDVCRVSAALYVHGQRVAIDRARLRPQQDSGLGFTVPQAVWRTRPSRLLIRVRTTTRGGTRSSVATLIPTYPGP